jgi:DICT domain-containing protein
VSKGFSLIQISSIQKLRPSLATKRTNSKQSKSNSSIKPRPRDAELDYEQTDERLHAELMDIAGDTIVEDDNE